MQAFELPTLSCQKCVQRVTTAVQQADATAQLHFVLPQRQVQIDSRLSRAELEQTLSQAGYTPAPVAAV
jgi:P-type Cu+ transporter